MKINKHLAVGLTILSVALTGCQVDTPYESISGVDSSKAKPIDLAIDEDNMSSTGISIFWDGAAAVKAGATSFTAQLVNEVGGAGDNYNSNLSKTVASVDKVGNINDAASFTKLKKGDLYYVRVRANYEYSVCSEWVYLERDGAVIQISVGNGVVISEFVAPQDVAAQAATYSSINVKWAMIGPADGYEISYKSESDADWTVSGTTVETQYTISGLAQLTTYSVRVRAYSNVEGGSAEYTDYTVINNISTPEKPVFAPEITTADQLAEFLTDIAAQAAADDSYKLMNDIDMSGKSIVPATSFLGTFDGQNYKIKNLSLDGVPMFETNSGTIKNVVLDASCVFIAGDCWGAVAGKNTGSVINCVNNAAVTIKDYSTAIKVGGLVGDNTGLVEKCTNSGAISFSGSNTASHGSIGGVVGMSNVAAGVVGVLDCINNGSIKFSNTTTPKNTYIGGVLGGTSVTELKSSAPQNNGTIKGCTNNGEILHSWDVSASGSYCNIGGVVGCMEGCVEDCVNTGNLSIKSPGSNSESSTRPALGGVAGSVIYDMKNCTNSGHLTIEGCFAAGTQGNKGAAGIHQPCVGGVVAIIGGDVTNGPNTSSNEVSGCSNSGVITTKFIQKNGGGTQYMVGGVVGWANVPVKSCSNTGVLEYSHGSKTQRMGGVAGATYKGLYDCWNDGPLTFDGQAGATGHDATGMAAYQNYIGGIVGYVYDAQDIKNCQNKVNGKVTYINGWASTVLNYVGGIMGSYNKGNQQMIDCSNAAEIVVSATESTCVCAGGVAGAFNGVMTNASNTGAVTVSTGPAYTGKENEVGGLVGYANASFVGCSNTAAVSANPAGTFVSAFIGGFGAANKQIDGCTISGTVSGAATQGSILGRFRAAGTYTLYYKSTTIDPALFGLSLCGALNGNNVTEGTMPSE